MEMRLLVRQSFSVDKLTRHLQKRAQPMEAGISKHAPARTRVSRCERTRSPSLPAHLGTQVTLLQSCPGFQANKTPASSHKPPLCNERRGQAGPGSKAVPPEPSSHDQNCPTGRARLRASSWGGQGGRSAGAPHPWRGRGGASVHPSTRRLPPPQSHGSQQEPGAAGERLAHAQEPLGSCASLLLIEIARRARAGLASSGVSHRALTARRVPRNWGQQDRNHSPPPSPVIPAQLDGLSQPPHGRTIKAGLQPAAGCWDQSVEPRIKLREQGAGRLYRRSSRRSEVPGTAILPFKCKCHLKESVLVCQPLSPDF